MWHRRPGCSRCWLRVLWLDSKELIASLLPNSSRSPNSAPKWRKTPSTRNAYASMFNSQQSSRSTSCRTRWTFSGNSWKRRLFKRKSIVYARANASWQSKYSCSRVNVKSCRNCLGKKKWIRLSCMTFVPCRWNYWLSSKRPLSSAIRQSIPPRSRVKISANFWKSLCGRGKNTPLKWKNYGMKMKH